VKLRITSLTLLFLALAAIPASAQLYSNGPINGTVDAWAINFGYAVSDTFTTPGAPYLVTGFDLGVWEYPGDTVLTLDWSITSAEFGGTTYGSGTASMTDTFISVNQFGYDIDQLSVTGLRIELSRGTYWLNIQNAVSAQGNPVFWDENSGVGCYPGPCPSSASDSAAGTIASEAFAVDGAGSPEPSSILLFGSGILGLAGVVRRKLF